MNTTTPSFSFILGENADRIDLRIYEIVDGKRVMHQVLQSIEITSAEFKIPSGVLQPGKDYGWQIYVVRAADDSLTYDSLSDMHYFTVLPDQ